MVSVLYYTENSLDDTVLGRMVKKHLEQAVPQNWELVCVSQRPIKFGDKNFIYTPIDKKGKITMLKQLLFGLRKIGFDEYVYLAEHDCLYDKSHYRKNEEFKHTINYNTNYYRCTERGYSRHYPGDKVLSQCSGKAGSIFKVLSERLWLLEHYGKCPPLEAGRGDRREVGVYESDIPSVDIRHEGCLTKQMVMPIDCYEIKKWGHYKNLRKRLGLKVNSLLSIRPDEIAMVGKEFDIRNNNCVIGGNWDREQEDFDSSFAGMAYRAMVHRQSGGEWKDTEYFAQLNEWVDKGERHWRVTCKEDIAKRLAFLDKLVVECSADEKIPDEYNRSDNVCVNIDRYGRLLLNNGRHRLAAAKVAGVKKINVDITVRHQQWNDFKSDIKTYANSHNGQIYAPIEHPDLRVFDSMHKNRLDKILPYIDETDKTVIDIGAHWGYHSGLLFKNGLIVTAVEANPNYYQFLTKIKKANGHGFETIQSDIGAFLQRDKRQWDIVLALRFFHHFFKTEAKFERLKKILRMLNVKKMFLQIHRHNDDGMQNAFMNPEADEYVELVLTNSCLNKSKCIAELETGDIYSLEK